MMHLRLVPVVFVLSSSTVASLYLQNLISRRQLIRSLSSSAAATTVLTVSCNIKSTLAFEGGVGGLGKTKPDTGVMIREGSAPIQNKQGIVSAEIVGGTGSPILIRFQTPWPLLTTTSGLEARDLQNSESAFVQVITGIHDGTTGKALNAAIIDTVFSSRGKYGAYGEPMDIKIKQVEGVQGLLTVTFTTYTPAMRENERKLFLKLEFVEGSLVMLVTGTTLQRFKSQEKVLRQVADSFVAVAAPKTGLKRPVAN